MAFYYESEIAKWQYKESGRGYYGNQGNWKDFDKKICKKLETAFLKHQKGDTSQEVQWTSDRKNYAVNLKTYQMTDSSRTWNKMEVQRVGYPYPPNGDVFKMRQLWDEFVDKGEDEISGKFDQLLKAIKINGNAIECLVFHAIVDSDELGAFTNVEKFVDNLAKVGCKSKKDVGQKCKEMVSGMNVKRMKKFMRYLYELAKNGEKKLSQIPFVKKKSEGGGDDSEEDDPDYLNAFFQTVFMQPKDSKKKYPLAKSGFEFLSNPPGTLVSRDSWILIGEFLYTHKSFDDVTDPDEWTTLITRWIKHELGIEQEEEEVY